LTSLGEGSQSLSVVSAFEDLGDPEEEFVG
jgi:hypothetical protein